MKNIKADSVKAPEGGEIAIYAAGREGVRFEVKLAGETVWLSQKQISELFKTERSVITKHLGNIFHSKELAENSVCAFFAHTAKDGKVYNTAFYNGLWKRTACFTRGTVPNACPITLWWPLR